MSQVRSQQPLEIVNGGGGQPCIPMRRDAAALRRRGEETPQTGEGGEGTTWPRQESVPGVPSIACECMGSAMGRNSERIARASKVAGVGAPQCDTACAESGPQGWGPSEIAQHRISMCPSCLPVPARASSRLAHSPPSRAINAGPTLGQRAPHATPVGTSRDRRYRAVKVTQIYY